MIAEFGLEDQVSHSGHLSLETSIEFQSECDALLLTSSKVIGGQDYSIAGKTYEYIKAQKPIIGYVADGAQKRLLQKSGVAMLCDPDNAIESSIALKRLIQGERGFNPNEDFLNSLNVSVLTGKLKDVVAAAF